MCAEKCQSSLLQHGIRMTRNCQMTIALQEEMGYMVMSSLTSTLFLSATHGQR